MFRAGRKKGGLGYAESLHYIKINLKRIKNKKYKKIKTIQLDFTNTHAQPEKNYPVTKNNKFYK